MTPTSIAISVVVPLMNEAESLIPLHQELIQAFDRLGLAADAGEIHLRR